MLLKIDENAIAAGVMTKNSALRTKRNGRAKLVCVIIMILIYFIKITLWKSDLVVDDFMNRFMLMDSKGKLWIRLSKEHFFSRSDV